MAPRFTPPPAEITMLEGGYSILVFVICFILYYKLRSIYKLTEYHGLHYFSNTFLFLGLAYFLRFIVFVFTHSSQPEFDDFRNLLIFSIAFMVYSSSASILYLIYSLTWRITEIFRNEALLHSLAILLTVLSLLSRPGSTLLIQAALLVVLLFAIVLNYKKYDTERKTMLGRIYPLYILTFFFWILNLLVSFRVFIPFEFRFLVYGLSILLLLIIAHRVLKKIG
ncbi:MAG: hypothetical protein QFX40_04810 [Archaeoglobales archaeon]|nr:hypothetical protein [Archaeoglobales archaeon]